MNTPTQHSMPWTATPPTSWPDAPTYLTFSTLKEIEACPRRWALSTASYPSLWDGRGYPSKANIKAMAGTVVHTVLETLTKELVDAGCESVCDPSAITVLQRLEGLSRVIEKAIDQVCSHLAANPRAFRLSDYFTRSLKSQIPELRSSVQTMLAKRTLFAKPNSSSTMPLRHERGPLSHGVYCELELRVPHLQWKGRADLLSLTPDTCEITDFKTGAPSEDHAFQLRIYAVLWYLDKTLNPTSSLATQLALAYVQGDTMVQAPTKEDIAQFEDELTARGATARKIITEHPPEAKPSAEQCRFCGVRHLCDVYWQPDIQQQLANEHDDHSKTFVDAEVSVTKQHGPKSWDISIVSDTDEVQGLLRTAGDLDVQPGQRLRVLDAALSKYDTGTNSVICLTIGTFSEIYIVSP